MCRTISLVVGIVLELALAGCLPVTTSSPLGTTVAATLDQQLIGMWKGKLGTSTNATYVAFYPGQHGLTKIVVLAPATEKDAGGWLALTARTATLGGYTYLDAGDIADDGRVPDPRLAHVPILYKLSRDGFLVLYLVDEKAARMAIEKGAIAGTVEPGEFGDVTISADPATLDRFFASGAGRALFTKPLGTLQRVH